MYVCACMHSRVSVLSRSGPSIVPVYMPQPHYRHCGGNRPYSAHCHIGHSHLCQAIFTGTVAGDRHYSIGTVERPLL